MAPFPLTYSRHKSPPPAPLLTPPPPSSTAHNPGVEPLAPLAPPPASPLPPSPPQPTTPTSSIGLPSSPLPTTTAVAPRHNEQPTHPLTTSLINVFLSSLYTECEPQSYRETLTDKHWRDAMDD
ncbi:hypothetical protein PIB30_080293 [Stylosanthes scabra]|uniref:Uncharacterized protein n=1 Tax=Stylosanthes scabra TaxID=79078 RepID=A0ABU6TQW9_9FABA|nr:hypothetical protein [Stylosanthes scabra]